MFLTTLGFIVLIATGWISEFITFQGERTIYTADCANGNWLANQCSGMVIAGKRYRFRALKAHREVLFWVAGSNDPSAKFSDCVILNGRNWSCKPNADLKYTITREMAGGSPVPDTSGVARPFHQITKWEWLYLHWFR
jgi:hypothetical protein